ncbi:MAG: ATP-dependent zinc metalloprotease FtsH [Thermodesulfobacteriota bacterium]
MENTPRDAKRNLKRPGLSGGFIWILLLLMLVYSLHSQFAGKDRPVAVSYSTFKQELEEGNISEVTFEGAQISGKFVKPYAPPLQAKPEDSGAKGAESSKKAKSSKKEEPSKERVQTYDYFSTTKPPIQDPALINLLDAHHVTVNAEVEGGSGLMVLLASFLPWILLLGLFWYGSRKMQASGRGLMQGAGGLFGIGKSGAKRYQSSPADITYEDVAGQENAKQDLQEVIQYLKDPQQFASVGAKAPRGILLIGPPGTGKTMLARATAGEAEVAFFSISASQFIEMFVGVGASRVRDLFQSAKQEAPAIIFIDELDAVGRARGTGLGGGNDEREQTLNQILSEMDGFEPHSMVIVMAATNRPDVLDPALTRPGRFDRQVVIDMPHKEARRGILMIHTREVPLADDVDLSNLAMRTVGFSGADLSNLVNEAAMLAARKRKKQVDHQDFEEARDRILLGTEREEMMNDDEKKIVAYHEGGHTLVAELLPDTDPLQKVTIIPRGRSLGATEQIPDADRHNFSRQYLMHRIAVMLGGRVAEKLVFEDYSSGAANDLKQATELARRMVCQWGMSERLGPVTYPQGEEHPFLGREIAQPRNFSEHTAEAIDEEIRALVKGMEDLATKLLKSNIDSLHELAEALLEHETLDKGEVDRILEGVDSTDEGKKKGEENGQEIREKEARLHGRSGVFHVRTETNQRTRRQPSER